MDIIIDSNSKNHSYTLAMNQFGDLAQDEVRSFLGYKPADRVKNFVFFSHNQIVNAPDEIDWTKKGVVTPIKNQGTCGTCWAFSATAAVESAYAIKTGRLISVSEQMLNDCSGSYGNDGCQGGLMDNAFKFIKDHGICSESDYPYIAKDAECKMDKCTAEVMITGYRDVPPNQQVSLKAAVARQPVSVAIEASSSDFLFYKSGVFDSDSCGTTVDDGVTIVGYGSLDGKEYWKVRQKWGTEWGMDGYILIARDSNFGPGMCGIAKEPSYPIA